MLLPSSSRQASLQRAPLLDDDILQKFFDPIGVAEDEDSTGTYSPSYVYSYEHESYEFSYSFELEDLDSYSYEFVDSMSEEEESYSYQFSEETFQAPPPPPGAVQSVTSMDVSANWTSFCALVQMLCNGGHCAVFDFLENCLGILSLHICRPHHEHLLVFWVAQ